MLATRFDITLDRAADYQFTLTVNNQAGTPVDISAATFHADVRNAITKAELLEFTSTAGGQTNEVVLSLSEAQTKTLSTSVPYEWDLFMIRDGTDTDRLIYGSLTCRDNLTNDV